MEHLGEYNLLYGSSWKQSKPDIHSPTWISPGICGGFSLENDTGFLKFSPWVKTCQEPFHGKSCLAFFVKSRNYLQTQGIHDISLLTSLGYSLHKIWYTVPVSVSRMFWGSGSDFAFYSRCHPSAPNASRSSLSNANACYDSVKVQAGSR